MELHTVSSKIICGKASVDYVLQTRLNRLSSKRMRKNWNSTVPLPKAFSLLHIPTLCSTKYHDLNRFLIRYEQHPRNETEKSLSSLYVPLRKIHYLVIDLVLSVNRHSNMLLFLLINSYSGSIW